ncbi:MAG: beta-galactosidase [Kiritimatiellales bacterium]
MNRLVGLLFVITLFDMAVRAGTSINNPVYNSDEIVPNPYIGWDYIFPADAYFTVEKPNGMPPAEFRMLNIEVGWDQLEPTNGVYNWALLDDVLDDLEDGWRMFNIRLKCQSAGRYPEIKGIPDWLWNMVPSLYVNGIRHPYYFDTVYQSKLAGFYTAFAAHFAGRVYMADFRCYGRYGEWDANQDYAFPWEDFPAVDKTTTLTQLVDIGYDAFNGSGIALNINFRASMPTNYQDYLDEAALSYAMGKGFNIRMDGYNTGFPGTNTPVTQAIAEYGGTKLIYGETSYGWDTNKIPNTLDPMLLTGINIGPKANIIWVDSLLTDHFDWYEKMMLFSGYRWVPTQIRYSSSVEQKQQITVSVDWENKGVGKLPLSNAYLAAGLKMNGIFYWEQIDNTNTFGLVDDGGTPVMWKLTDAGDGYVYIGNKQFGDERLKSVDGATQFDLTDADAADDGARWQLVDAHDNGYYFIQNKQFSNACFKAVDGTNEFCLISGGCGYPVMWKFIDAGNGYYFIENRQFNDERLSVSGGFNFKNKGPGTWTVDHTFTLNNEIPPCALNLWIAIVDDNGTPFIEMPISNFYTNGWSLVGSVTAAFGDSYYYIQNSQYSDECLKSVDGAQSFDLTTDTGYRVMWKFADAGNGYYYIQNRQFTNECLESVDGMQSFCLTANPEYAGMWKPVGTGTEYFYLKNRQFTNECLKSVDGGQNFDLTTDTGYRVMWKFQKP